MGVKKRSRAQEVWRQLKKNKLAIVGLFVLIALVLVAIFAPLIAPYPFDEQHPELSFAKPSSEHILGCDKLGRDTFSRLVWGSRQSLMIGFFSVALASVIGIIFGALAGYYGGFIDTLLMRILDIYQAVPTMLLCLTLAAIMGAGLRSCIISLGVSSVAGYARMMRATVLTVRDKEFVEAAKAIEASDLRILVKHIIPNAISPLIVQITMGVGSSILMGAALSFIGLGVQPPTPEWGTMISEARSFLRQQPQLALYPGLCIMASVLSCNLLGDGLRDALDPRQKN